MSKRRRVDAPPPPLPDWLESGVRTRRGHQQLLNGLLLGARMPDEMLAHIFHFVDTRTAWTVLRAVCRRWRAIVETPFELSRRLRCLTGRDTCARCLAETPPPQLVRMLCRTEKHWLPLLARAERAPFVTFCTVSPSALDTVFALSYTLLFSAADPEDCNILSNSSMRLLPRRALLAPRFVADQLAAGMITVDCASSSTLVRDGVGALVHELAATRGRRVLELPCSTGAARLAQQVALACMVRTDRPVLILVPARFIAVLWTFMFSRKHHTDVLFARHSRLRAMEHCMITQRAPDAPGALTVMPHMSETFLLEPTGAPGAPDHALLGMMTSPGLHSGIVMTTPQFAAELMEPSTPHNHTFHTVERLVSGAALVVALAWSEQCATQVAQQTFGENTLIIACRCTAAGRHLCQV